jgi:hypothetical protein
VSKAVERRNSTAMRTCNAFPHASESKAVLTR